jgi:ABC-type polysaccharide/polyol phosphate transport system ATPase subunit
MQEPILSARQLRLIYPVFSLRSLSLRNTVVNAATGGRLLRDARDVVHVQALDSVSFDLHEGDRMAIFGHNGAGKTTLLKVLAGIYEPTTGDLRIRGRVSSMVDIGHGMDIEATGIENIRIMSQFRGFTQKEIKERVPEIIEFAELGNFIHLPVKTYSTGMIVRLMFATSTCFDPEILILDEWLGAGDARFMNKAAERMDQFVARSKLVVIATHSTDLIKRICNKICVLDAGKVKYFGEPLPYLESIGAA